MYQVFKFAVVNIVIQVELFSPKFSECGIIALLVEPFRLPAPHLTLPFFYDKGYLSGS